MTGITLITPTSDRPAAFALCEHWMQRAMAQISDIPMQWIVADDGDVPANCTLNQQHLRRTPNVNSAESFRGNLLNALQQVEQEWVLFIEDDDWYAEQYLASMMQWLQGDVKIAGEAMAKYYNIQQRRFHHCRNRRHASLCQTGIHHSLVPWLTRLLQRPSDDVYIDIALWRNGARRQQKHLARTTSLCIGMKGLPGKTGIGIGHRLDRQRDNDPQGKVLEQWIGKADAALYWKILAEHQSTGGA